jgi:hypothetical protein
MTQPQMSNEEIARRGEEWYTKHLRDKVETADNLGKILVIDTDTGEYEIDSDEIAASRRAMAKHPGHALYMMRIGYNAVHTLGGRLEPTKQ